jgi:hypothetical protein
MTDPALSAAELLAHVNAITSGAVTTPAPAAPAVVVPVVPPQPAATTTPQLVEIPSTELADIEAQLAALMGGTLLMPPPAAPSPPTVAPTPPAVVPAAAVAPPAQPLVPVQQEPNPAAIPDRTAIAEAVVAVVVAEEVSGGAAQPPKRRGRPVGSKNKPKAPAAPSARETPPEPPAAPQTSSQASPEASPPPEAEASPEAAQAAAEDSVQLTPALAAKLDAIPGVQRGAPEDPFAVRGYALCVDCLPVGVSVIPLALYLAPLMAEAAALLGQKYYALEGYGKGKAMLAAVVQKALQDDPPQGFVAVDSTSEEWGVLGSLLTARADAVVVGK